MKYSAFVEEIAKAIRLKIQGSNPGDYFFCLITDAAAENETPDFFDTFSLLACEANFKGYARLNLSAIGFIPVTTPTTFQRRVKSNPLHFAYDSGASGSASNVCDKFAIICNIGGGGFQLYEVGFLPEGFTFAADGDEKTYAYFIDDKNCVDEG